MANVETLGDELPISGYLDRAFDRPSHWALARVE
jgi:hypothetical protein